VSRKKDKFEKGGRPGPKDAHWLDICQTEFPGSTARDKCVLRVSG
jgi:hypothetical protein